MRMTRGRGVDVVLNSLLGGSPAGNVDLYR
jgi:hypothetical protein